jgi:hypothetical protein
MYRIINKDEIHASRGDAFSLDFKIKNYTFVETDSVKFAVFEEGSNYENPLMIKYANIDLERNAAVFSFDANDTSFGEAPTERTLYVYEISVEGDQTVLGYDTNKAKKYYQYPAQVGDK